ncbi:MAG: bifunctional folylpolyglutamate synthase/dihydrofolate synthase [Solobacterium sp.]|nr:bifunctional folylpolyglutamate synthase/dihydrofolate synthase [Solobacterium sp.]
MSRRNREHGFAHFQQAMKLVGDPQDSFRSVHIAGTNGKGSVTNYIAHLLMSRGYKVGMFTSPHLVEHRDRIRINDRWIPEEDLLRLVNTYHDFIEEQDLAMFEIDVLLASVYFKEQQVDWAVMEVGLGGRLDGTNTMHHPELSVITTIGMDHMDRLGDTYARIAKEKAGIIKPNGRVLIGYLNEEAETAVRETAGDMHAELIKAAEYTSLGGQRFRYDNDEYELKAYGEYQKANASVALEAFRLLGFDIHTDTVKNVLQTCTWAGRFEVISEHPVIILDGAHNEEGMRALTASMQDLSHPRIGVFSALADKQGQEMAAMMRDAADRLYVTQFTMYRADTAAHLAVEGTVIEEDWQKALQRAEEDAGENGTVIISGSLYFISIVRDYLLNNG